MILTPHEDLGSRPKTSQQVGNTPCNRQYNTIQYNTIQLRLKVLNLFAFLHTVLSLRTKPPPPRSSGTPP